MVTIAVQLPDEQAERLATTARQLQVSVEELAAAHLLDVLAKPDKRFEEAARYVLAKNDELYRRLA
jgi:hypothetical protein